MKKININLSLKLGIVAIIGVLTVFSSFGIFRIYTEKKSLTVQLNSSGQERATLIAESLANLIVAYDYSNIESLAERIVKMQDVQQINVINRHGKVMTSRKSADLNPQMNVLTFFAPVIFSGETIGKVELLVSLERFETSINTIYRNVLAAVSFATILMVILIYTTVSRFVVKPLTRLSKAADQLAVGNYAAELPLVTGDEMGNLIRTFASMRESRKMNEARLKAVFDHSPDAFIQLDNNGDITDWNAKAESIWGYEKNEVMGKNFSIVLPPQESSLNKDYRKCYQKSENIIGVIRELFGQRKDGTLFPLELRTNEMHFEDETAFLVSARDITERKENEATLLRTMKAAEAANAAKSAFLSNMSHEIRTPMNSIIGMTSLALKTDLNAKQHDYLAKIGYSANHLLSLINDILDFSKIEANRLELDNVDFELDVVFKNLSNQLAHSASLHGLKLNVDLDTRLAAPLRGDPMRLFQILLNYTSNAIKFTDKGKISVSGKMLEEGVDDVLIRFEVRDTGIGLNQDEIAQLFRPFHQADTSTTRKYGGTGLGLAISKQLVELMGGMVGVESQPGQGSTFWFTARLKKGEKLIANQPLPMIKPETLKDVSILLVEDNLFNQQVALEMLREVDAVVEIANNGKECIDRLLVKHYDCVLMDVQMPVMDGLEATRQIRSNPALADTYIIAMTANAGKEDRERCFDAGMDGFISKPVFADQLYEVIVQGIAPLQQGNKPKEGATKISEQTTALKTEKSLGLQQKNKVQDEVINLNALGKMLGGKRDKIQKFANKFLHSARQGLEEIEVAMQQESLDTLASLGHRNKSPARTVGALAYADLCQTLEKFKNGGEIEQARQIVSQMGPLLEQIAAQIEREFSES